MAAGREDATQLRTNQRHDRPEMNKGDTHMTKKKETKLPLDYRDWDARVKLRWLSRLENVLRKVPGSVVPDVYNDAIATVHREFDKAMPKAEVRIEGRTGPMPAAE